MKLGQDMAIVIGIVAIVFGGLWYLLGPPRVLEASARSEHTIVWLGCSEDGEHWHRVGPSESIQGFVAMARREPDCRVLRMELDKQEAP